MNRLGTLALMLALGAIGNLATADEAADRKALLAALPAAKVTLLQGLDASSATGTPLSAKFEIDDGHLQLSVYTQKGGTFSEIIVDHQTGKVGKTEAISGGEDLVAANAQGRAMAKGKLSLRDAVAKAEEAAPGFHAYSATALTRKGHAAAKVKLQNGTAVKTVSESLE